MVVHVREEEAQDAVRLLHRAQEVGAVVLVGRLGHRKQLLLVAAELVARGARISIEYAEYAEYAMSSRAHQRWLRRFASQAQLRTEGGLEESP